jgi:hypothetical protein
MGGVLNTSTGPRPLAQCLYGVVQLQSSISEASAPCSFRHGTESISPTEVLTPYVYPSKLNQARLRAVLRCTTMTDSSSSEEETIVVGMMLEEDNESENGFMILTRKETNLESSTRYFTT